MSFSTSLDNMIRCQKLLQQICDKYPNPLRITSTGAHTQGSFTNIVRGAIKAYRERPDWRKSIKLSSNAEAILIKTQVFTSEPGVIIIGPPNTKPQPINFGETKAVTKIIVAESKLDNIALNHIFELLQTETINVTFVVPNASNDLITKVKTIRDQSNYNNIALRKDEDDLLIM